MKANKNFSKLVILIAIAVVSIAGCKKDNSSNNNSSNVNTNSMQNLAQDDNNVQAVSDAILNDANQVLSGGSGKDIEGFPCNVTIDSASIVGDTITYSLTYHGLSCDNKFFRTGNVQIKKDKNEYWYQAGTSVRVILINLKVTRISNGKSIIFNGSKTFENVSGGFLVNLGGSDTMIVHKVTGYIKTTFDNNTMRTWYIARQKTFKGSFMNASLTLSVEGLGSADGYNNLETWGINRDGEQFYSQITQAVVFWETCNWDPVLGTLIYQIPVDSKKATVTFGYENDMPIIGNNCPTQFQLIWAVGAQTGKLYFPL